MPKFITETNSVICIDDEYIDTNEIAKVSKVTEFIPKNKKVWIFNIMLKGHSNVIHFESPEEEEAELKRRFIISAWSSDNLDEIPSFEGVLADMKAQEEADDEFEADDDLN